MNVGTISRDIKTEMLVTESELACATSIAQMEPLLAAVRKLGACGWMPAGSGNFSVRVDAQSFAVTVSGCDKLNLVTSDLMLVDINGNALEQGRVPSAECLLHAHIYRRCNEVGCILHTHSITQTLASLRYAELAEVKLSGYELLKAMQGYDSHLQTLRVPVVANDQHMPALQAAIDPLLDQHSRAYLIAGHGMYCWGADVAAALRHAEALDFMLECELKRYG